MRNFYEAAGLSFLHEIRVSEEASARLTGDLYDLFWNNESSNENAPSDEMAELLRGFARPRREKDKWWKTEANYLLDEYRYEYGSFHAPYAHTAYNPDRRRDFTWTELLHPLFIERDRFPALRIGHITDTHVDIRADVYEENLNQSPPSGRVTKKGETVTYNNWNKSFVSVYDDAKLDSDVILLTGDLIDYGRGHWGVTQRKRLSDDSLYQQDRNWFLLYYLLAAGKAYTPHSSTVQSPLPT